MLRPLLFSAAVVTAGATIYAAYVAIRLLSLVGISNELVRQSKSYEQDGHGGPRILVMGDSTAVGTGVTDPRGSIAGRFGADYPAAEVRNVGINGLRAAGLLQSFPSYPDQSFDLVFIQIGANDIMRGTPAADFTRDLAAVFDKSTLAGKHVVALHSGNIGLAPFFAWPLSVYMRSQTLAYRDAYKRIAAEKGVTYVDQFHEAADDPFNGEHRYYARDLLHLSEEGYGIWYREARTAMAAEDVTL